MSHTEHPSDQLPCFVSVSFGHPSSSHLLYHLKLKNGLTINKSGREEITANNMKKYILVVLPLLRFFFLVSSSSTYINNDGETAQEVEKAKIESHSSNLISTDGGDSTEMLEKALHNYDRKFRPNFRGGPVIVKVTMKILTVPIYLEKEFRWVLEAEITQKWKDERLDFNTSKVIWLAPVHALDTIWQPHVGFEAAESRIHSAFNFHQSYQIHPGGTISHVFQTTLSTHCAFLMHDFPVDRRTCQIYFGSISFGVKQVVYKWADNVQRPVKFLNVALKNLTDWSYKNFRLFECIKISDKETNFSRINFELTVDRRPAWGIILYVISLTGLVICSYIPSVIPDNLSARIISGVGILGATVVMVLNRPVASENALPYYTYVDLYSLASLLQVMACLWQSAVVIYMKNREKAGASYGIGSEKLNKIFQISTPIATMIIAGGFGIAVLLTYQARMPDEGLRATVSANCDDAGESV